MQAILFVLLAFFSHRDSRAVVVYDQPSQVVSASLGETLMAQPTKEGTYRFAVSIETRPGEGCEADTALYFVRSYINTKGLSAGQRTEIKIRRTTISSTAEIPASVFRVKARSRISYHVEFLVGGQCKTRPSYQVFPLLEQVGR